MLGIDQILSNKPGQNYRDLKKGTYHIFKREGGKVWLKFVHSLLPNSTFINLVSSISLLLPHTLQTWNIIVEKCEKVGLKLNIQKIKIITSGCITSWQIDGETMETVTVFFWGGAPKSLQMVTAAMKLKDAYSLERKLWPTWMLEKGNHWKWKSHI